MWCYYCESSFSRIYTSIHESLPSLMSFSIFLSSLSLSLSQIVCVCASALPFSLQYIYISSSWNHLVRVRVHSDIGVHTTFWYEWTKPKWIETNVTCHTNSESIIQNLIILTHAKNLSNIYRSRSVVSICCVCVCVFVIRVHSFIRSFIYSFIHSFIQFHYYLWSSSSSSS